MALGARGKLGFINGTVPPPPTSDSSDLQIRIRTDYMIRTWGLNFISAKLFNAYMYVNSSNELWDTLKERYGQCNTALLYQLQKEIAGVTQGSDDIAIYFTQLVVG